jgi:hypothetical protein
LSWREFFVAFRVDLLYTSRAIRTSSLEKGQYLLICKHVMRTAE